MEINPRLSAAIEVAVRAGVDFPLLIHRWATRADLPAPAAYRTGVRMRWLAGDLLWLADTVRTQSRTTTHGKPDYVGRGKAIATFALDTVRGTGYDYVARDDLRPVLPAVRGFARFVAEIARR